jgi:hypothetical protein
MGIKRNYNLTDQSVIMFINFNSIFLYNINKYI